MNIGLMTWSWVFFDQIIRGGKVWFLLSCVLLWYMYCHCCVHIWLSMWFDKDGYMCVCMFCAIIMALACTSPSSLFPAVLPPVQGSWDPPGPPVLWGHRHVVAGLRHRGALPGLAALPWILWVWPNTLHLPDPGPASRTHAQCCNQDHTIF